MTEIKFRTWNPEHKFFHYWGFNNELDQKYYFIGPPSGGGFVSDKIFMYTQQFIGLHDIENKEIYIGDIVNVYDRDNELIIENAVVTYDEKSCSYKVGTYFIFYDAVYKVVGHIYEK